MIRTKQNKKNNKKIKHQNVNKVIFLKRRQAFKKKLLQIIIQLQQHNVIQNCKKKVLEQILERILRIIE